MTNAEIGRHTNLSEGAVRRRIARLQEKGIIVRFTTVTTPLGPEGMVLIRCRPDSTSRVLERVRPLAMEVFETSGEYDLGAILECETMEKLNATLDAVRSSEGVDATLTLIRLSRWIRPGDPSGAAAGVPPARPKKRGPASSRSP